MRGPLKPLSRVAALSQKAMLREFIDYARGDPLLTAFEERFVSDMRWHTDPDAPLPSRKQAAIVKRIKAKIGYGNPDWVPPDEHSPDDEGLVEY